MSRSVLAMMFVDLMNLFLEKLFSWMNISLRPFAFIIIVIIILQLTSLGLLYSFRNCLSVITKPTMV